MQGLSLRLMAPVHTRVVEAHVEALSIVVGLSAAKFENGGLCMRAKRRGKTLTIMAWEDKCAGVLLHRGR